MDFKNFRNIFGEDLNPEKIEEVREEYYSAPNEWMEDEPIHYTLDNISLDKPRFCVDIDGIGYECLFLSKIETKRLYVSLSNFPYPSYFVRWKYGNIFNSNLLCITDPLTKEANTDIVPRWFYGTKDRSYKHEILKIVKNVIKILELSANDVVFVGSSSAGYAALFMANLLSGSTAIAMSPQVVLGNYHSYGAPKKYYQSIGVNLDGDDKFNRNFLKLNNKESIFVFIVNFSYRPDYEEHFIPFCISQNIEPKYGISQYENIITWVHASNGWDSHACFLEAEIPFIDFLIQEVRNGSNINELRNFSYILNERINNYFELEKKYVELEETSKTDVKIDTKSIEKKIKNYLSYKLGQAFIEGVKTWYKGGLIIFLFKAWKIKKEHEKSKI